MRRIIAALLTFMCICQLFGCTAKPEITASDSIPTKTTSVPIDSSLAPLSLTEASMSVSNITVTYPVVYGAASDSKINELIRKKINELGSENDSNLKSVTCSVCYNNKGIFSMLIDATVRDSDGRRYKAVTVNAASGAEITLGTNFTEGSMWDRIAAFYIASTVRLIGTETFASLNVNENKSFCLTDNKLIVLYETYEYTYYANGSTLFSVPYRILSDCIAHGSAIGIICGKE